MKVIRDELVHDEGCGSAVTLAELPEYARVSQVAELLGLSRSEVYRMAERGELPCTRVSETAVRIPKAELVAWLRERTRGAVTGDRQPPPPRLTIVSENRKSSRRAARR